MATAAQIANRSRIVQAFVKKVEKFTILNGAPKTVVVDCPGMRLFIPGADEVKEAEPSLKESAWQLISAKDEKGNYIPGTLELMDDLNARGDVQWSAKRAVQFLLGIDSVSGQFSGPSFEFGIRLVPEDVTPEELADIRKEARESWEQAAVRAAARLVSEFRSMAQREQAAGLPIPPAPKHVNEAAQLVKYVSEKNNTALDKILGVDQGPAAQILQEKKLTEVSADIDRLVELKVEAKLKQLLAAQAKDEPEPEPQVSKKRA